MIAYIIYAISLIGVTVDFIEFIRFDESTGIGIAYFSTNSTEYCHLLTI